MSTEKKVLKEVERTELDTVGRIMAAARKHGLPRHDIKAKIEKLNKQYFADVRTILAEHVGK